MHNACRIVVCNILYVYIIQITYFNYSIWGVLKEDTLYVYSQPIDECTMDALTVSDWEVGQTDVISNKPNVLMFKHKVNTRILPQDVMKKHILNIE